MRRGREFCGCSAFMCLPHSAGFRQSSDWKSIYGWEGDGAFSDRTLAMACFSAVDGEAISFSNSVDGSMFVMVCEVGTASVHFGNNSNRTMTVKTRAN